jgi:hypothetical protein
MKNRILLSLFLIASFASCSSPGKVTRDPNGQRLIFGNGGGFTGIYTNYELYEDGNIFIFRPDSTLQPLKKLRKKQTHDIFMQASKLKISQPEFNHPGNMTWFIKYKVNGVTTEYKWGESNAPAPGEIQDFYNQLNSIIK